MPRLKELKVLNDKLGNRMSVFTYEDGRIMRYSLHENKIVSNEYAYIHFLKRPIEIACNGIPQSFLIVPNQFINMEPITLELIVKHVGKGIFGHIGEIASNGRTSRIGCTIGYGETVRIEI